MELAARLEVGLREAGEEFRPEEVEELSAVGTEIGAMDLIEIYTPQT